MSKVTRMMIEEVDGEKNEIHEVKEPKIVEPEIAPIVKENLVQRDIPRAHNHNRIILFNILKNENKIAKRMLSHVLP
jgi:hypothetical protein